MKNSILLLSLLFTVLVFSCHREECNAFSGKVLTAPMETYFGAYKYGTWGIYHNRDSTRSDSVYVSSFIDSVNKNTVNCTVFEKRTFTLHNTFLASANDINVVYRSTDTSTTFNMAASNTTFPSFAFAATDSLIRSLPAAENPGDNRLDSVVLNGQSYHTIIKGKSAGNTYYFGKDKGLVGWINATDTFNLVRVP
jgi:hypothetical protein